ncbi:transmembrane and TPR repeat-containing protein 4 [Geobacter sp. OR-1]|uniref:tetratricopeptide repeat protein n=1 Tax=Geobacter sp. OR-1 TaxID=1266765 RepID=UPI0005437793|nr:tetratricopeptide repeat protein [Geobacter sp. OR-1]GAM10567.1 transmembrane and TPR repeat-containing protein 4 [Geobacter sp. OR-1]
MKSKAITAVVLCASVLLCYWQVGGHQFIAFDDLEYILENQQIREGVTLSGAKWAFTAFYAANWHPLTWLSHMLDIQMFGLHPAGHHLVNVAIHAVNAVLLFLLLARMTGYLWRSAVVAALFALHPLHVESVAWVSERKDLLCAFFGFLTLYLYARYVEKRTAKRYVSVVAAYVFGLLAKPMIVTLPFLMLLLDYWPLHRFRLNAEPSEANRESILRLLFEKTPFFVCAAVSSIITVNAQQSAIRSFADSSMTARFANSLLSILSYLRKTFLPTDLAIFYPLPGSFPFWKVTVSALFLTAVTVVVVRERNRHPWLIVGWCWFLGTLVPVIGIVQVGMQSMADRYMYIPLTGIFIMVVWGFSELSAKVTHRNHVAVAVTVIALMACSLLTCRQTAFWKDNLTLFSHALSVTENNYLAMTQVGIELEKRGNIAEAMKMFEEAVRVAPGNAYAVVGDALTHQGLCLKKQGRIDEAIERYNRSIQLVPTNLAAYVNLGIALAVQKRFEEAAAVLVKAIAVDPASPLAHYNLGVVVDQLGRPDDAIKEYLAALSLNPYDERVHNNVGIKLAEQGRLDEAIRYFREALRLKPDFAGARENLEFALKQSGASGAGK